jgi:hypothetical protein
MVNIDTLSFIEKVFALASKEKIQNISISNKSKSIGEKRDRINKNTILINLQGNYRETAEFIRELFNLDYNFIISKIEMTAIDKEIKTTITIDFLVREN